MHYISKSKLFFHPSLDILMVYHRSSISSHETALRHSVANLRIITSSARVYAVQGLIHSDWEVFEPFDVCFW